MLYPGSGYGYSSPRSPLISPRRRYYQPKHPLPDKSNFLSTHITSTTNDSKYIHSKDTTRDQESERERESPLFPKRFILRINSYTHPAFFFFLTLQQYNDSGKIFIQLGQSFSSLFTFNTCTVPTITTTNHPTTPRPTFSSNSSKEQRSSSPQE